MSSFWSVLLGGAGSIIVGASVLGAWKYAGRLSTSVKATEQAIPRIEAALKAHAAKIDGLHSCLDDVQRDVKSLVAGQGVQAALSATIHEDTRP